jgi:hypothetical protein
MQCIILSDNSLHSILRLFHMLAVVQWWVLFQSAVIWSQHI